MAPQSAIRYASYCYYYRDYLEAAIGIEPMNKGFAELMGQF